MKLCSKRTALAVALASLFTVTANAAESFTQSHQNLVYDYLYIWKANRINNDSEHETAYFRDRNWPNGVIYELTSSTWDGSKFFVMYAVTPNFQDRSQCTVGDVTATITDSTIGKNGGYGQWGRFAILYDDMDAFISKDHLVAGKASGEIYGSTFYTTVSGFMEAGAIRFHDDYKDPYANDFVNPAYVDSVSISATDSTFRFNVNSIDEPAFSGVNLYDLTYDTKTYIGDADRHEQAITVSLTDSALLIPVYGLKNTISNGTLYVYETISVTVQDGVQADGADIYGVYYKGENPTMYIGGGNEAVVVNVSGTNLDTVRDVDPGNYKIEGVYIDSTEGVLYVTGDTVVNVSNSYVNTVRGFYSNAFVSVYGDVHLNLADILSDNATFIGVEAAGRAVALYGDIDITYSSEEGNMPNGVLIGLLVDERVGIHGDLSVTIDGNFDSSSGTLAIIGTYVGPDVTLYRFTGERTITFGTNNVFFDASEGFTGVFANFDKMVIKSGSTLTLSSTSQGKIGAFGDYAIESDAISSYNGLLYIHDSNELTVNTAARLNVSGLYSTGLITSSGTISATNARLSGDSSDYENHGTGSFSNLIVDGKGTYINYHGARITGGTVTLENDATFENYGTFSISNLNLADRNYTDADTYFNNYEGATLNVSDEIEVTRGTLTNNGTITTDGLLGYHSNSYVTNYGDIYILGTRDNSLVQNLFENYGTLIVEGKKTFTVQGGSSSKDRGFLNYGALAQGGDSTIYVSGDGYLKNAESSTFMANGTVSIHATSPGGVENYGDMYIDTLKITQGSLTSYIGSTTVVAKASIGSSGSIYSDNDFTFTESLINRGSITIDGTGIFDGATIENSGSITVGTMQADGVMYTQTGGSLTVINSTENANWFTNSVITLSDGTLKSYSLGSGDTYVIDGGTFTVSIVSGSSGSTVTIGTNGNLEVEKLFSDGTPSSTVITLAGGTLTTSADQIFSSVSTDSNSSVQSVGSILDSVQAGVDFQSGYLTITDNYTIEAVSSITNSLSGIVNQSGLTVSFSGNLSDPTISVSNANALMGETNNIYLILSTATLNASGSSGTLTVGDDGDLVSGLGFMNVEGVNAITLKRKGELILMSLNGDDCTSNQLLVGAENGGSVTIEEEAKLTLGMLGGDATAGWIGSADNAGTLQINNGKFLICTLTLNNSGDIVIDDSATLYSQSLDISGTVENYGVLQLVSSEYFDENSSGDALPKDAELTIGGDFYNGEAAVLEALFVEKTTISGTLTNKGSVGFSDVEITGTAINEELAAWTTMGTVTITGSKGLFTNAGDMSAYGLAVNEGSTFTNSGYFNVTDVEETGATTTIAGTLENSGAFKVDTSFTVSGTVENSGAVSTTADVTVSGNLGAIQNLEGAYWSTTNDDSTATLAVTDLGIVTNRGAMTVDALEAGENTVISNAGTGSFTVNGDSTVEGALTNLGNFSIGGELTLTGKLTNSGDSSNDAVMSISGELTAEAGSSIVNEEYGFLVLNDSSTIEGTISNQGTLVTADIAISDTVENSAGAAWFTMTDSTETFAIMNLKEGSSLTNEGTMYADELDVASGVSVTNAEGASFTVGTDNTIAGTLSNSGDFTATGTLSLTGEIDNSSTGVVTVGNLDLTGTFNNDADANLVMTGASTIAGTLDNQGYLGSMDIDISGKAVNGDDAAWTTLGTVTVTGTLTNNGDMSADAMIVSDGATVTTTNNLTVASTLTVEGGSLDIQSGALSSYTSVLTSGTITVGSSSAVDAELGTPKEKVGAQIYVQDGSRLSLSTDYGLDWADGVLGSKKGNLLVVSDSIVTDATGYISVGSSSSSVSPLAASSDAGLYFGSDSTLVVRNLVREEQGLFNTQDGTTATVESGAALFMSGNFDKDATYYILRGYNVSIEDDAWGLNTDSEDTVSGKDDAGLKWTFHTVTEDDTVYVQAVEHEDISNLYNIAVPNIANDELDYYSTSTTGGFLQAVLYSDSLSTAEKEQIINSAANLAFAGGVMTTALTDATAAFDSVVNHLTMDGDTFGKDGNLWPWDKGGNLWVDVLGSWQHGKHLDATKISGYKYRTQSYGIVLGYDHKLEDRPVVLGGAFSFSDGILKSKGGVNKTKNEYQTYGLSFFGNYSPSPYYNIIGSLHWFHNSADVKQPSSVGKVAAQLQTNMLAVGLRGETTIKAGQVNIVPHAEARYIYGKTSKYTTKFDGNNVWNTKSDGTHTVQFPVGVAFRGDIKTESGWNVRPRADLSVIPQVGSTKQKSVVRSSSGVTDAIDGQFLGKFGGSVKVGFQADKGNATVGLRYGFLGGTKGRADHSVMLQGRYRF